MFFGIYNNINKSMEISNVGEQTQYEELHINSSDHSSKISKNIDPIHEYIVPIYIHDAIQIVDDNGYKKMIATQDIALGELLVVEHVYAAANEYCCLVVDTNKYLFNTYHPRKTLRDNCENSVVETQSKISHNCFGYGQGEKIIPDYMRIMNHSCRPNSVVYLQEKYKFGDTNIVFMELYSIKKIEKNQEVTISYGPETAHKRDFECLCGLEIEDRQKLFTIGYNLVKIFNQQHADQVKQIIIEYLETPVSKKILLNHFLAKKGIFMNNGHIASYTIQGQELIDRIVKKFLGINPENNSNLPENTAKKIEIFMKILEIGLLKS